MLAYAFRSLTGAQYMAMSFETFEHAEDLLAAILALGIAGQIKRGLGRDYLIKAEPLSSPRGRLDIAETVKQRSFLRRRINCEFDELSENTYFNRVLKTAANTLLHSDNVRQEQKNDLKKVLFFFHGVDTLRRHEIRWPQMKFHRNNATYKMLMHICYLVLEGFLPDILDGTKKMRHFKDDVLYRLYERFLFGFYKKEHPELQVSSSHITWATDDGVTDFLPAMKTDVTLDFADHTLIIDAKFYAKTMQIWRDKRSVHSHNLYQIFSYVKNRACKNNASVAGLLLYAKTDEDVAPDCSYQMSGNRIDVKTLDLNKEFSSIKDQLDEIVKDVFRDVL